MRNSRSAEVAERTAKVTRLMRHHPKPRTPISLTLHARHIVRQHRREHQLQGSCLAGRQQPLGSFLLARAMCGAAAWQDR